MSSDSGLKYQRKQQQQQNNSSRNSDKLKSLSDLTRPCSPIPGILLNSLIF